MKIPNTNNLDLAIDVSGLCFAWDSHDPLLEIDSLQIKRGERIFIYGPSGSGKSTLLSLIAGVVTPQKGTITINDQRVSALNGAERDRFRADHIGFIYQMFNLIPYLSVVENVTLPCRFSLRRRERAAARSSSFGTEAMRLLKSLGLDSASVIKKPANELSVGQQQRVAAARALIGAPEIIIADEPTSSLDIDHRKAFIRLLFQECDPKETSLIFVSHDTTLANLFDQTIRLADINKI
ncbi:MAG: ABC transporter ATP-binding protein [Desulfobacterales bacterium]|jgi:putative ABC transport system ATP-binding protein|nr:ABC transporter ATP-binding protein [Desulfobacterales bacterium]MDP6683814.1 ABC transporter ATP-binding protein [Desulfobacterales bacterium]MDP6806203.1 ABC transporter ATP-binding protein [Desulfobacterales bacterium]|tara:strand:+ start:3677 stop:4390 length:714 start_codon:yes stop_codon:yes gene_type:complete